MKKILFVGLIIVLIATTGISQKKEKTTIAFYNVENLFDTIDNPLTRDEDFLPQGKLKWNTQRYQDKLSKLAKVLSSITPNNLPGIIGLCEVENRNVVAELAAQNHLRKGKYRIIHKDSPGNRGIDCALLYKKRVFKPVAQQNISISIPSNPNFKTRDILYVKGKLYKKEYLHIFVTHWPSRRGGQKKSEKNRIAVAEEIKSVTDSILKMNEDAKIVIMGDFNDEPSNKAVQEILNAKNETGNYAPAQLHNLMFATHLKKQGSYYYRGNWNMLDNFVVSPALLDPSKGYHTAHGAGKIFKQSWFCYRNKKDILVPSRTYGGPNYYGGYSDHFPIYFILTK
jgi:predicted extracellular nuclease